MKSHLQLKNRHWFIFLLISVSVLAGCHTHFIPLEQTAHRYTLHVEQPADTSIKAFYAPFKEEMEAQMNTVIGTSDIMMTRSRQHPETLLGNFFADILLHEGQKHDADIAFSVATKDGVRIDLPKGDITRGMIFELMPFENKLVILEISGEEVSQLAAFIAQSGGQPVSGLTMEINQGNAINVSIAGQPVVAGKTYKLVTYDYLANGGDRIQGLDKPLLREDLPVNVRESIISYVQEQAQAGKPITSTLDGRIK